MKFDHQKSGKNEVLAVFEWINRHKTWAAWISFLALCISLLVKEIYPALYITCVLLYLAAITATLLDIHRQIEPPITRFSSHAAANPSVFEEIEKAAKQGRCEICWLGVTMTSAWLTLENKLRPLIVKQLVQNLTVRLLQSDPDFLKTILDPGHPMCENTRTEHGTIVDFSIRYKTELDKSESKIEIFQYSYMPNFHGLLINNSILYLSTVRWEGPKYTELSVPHEPFERYDRSTEKGEYLINLFISWFEKGVFASRSKLPVSAASLPVSTPSSIPPFASPPPSSS